MYEKSITPKTKRTVSALIASGVLTASMLGTPMLAIAADNSPSAGANSGSGQTELTMIARSTVEHGGTADDSTNVDGNNDGMGDNIAFTVPSSINFVVGAKGELTGPGSTIENHSAFAARVSSMKVDAAEGWNFVADAAASDAPNAVDLQIGPSGNLQQASEFTSAKANVTGGAVWNMSAASEGTSDQIALEATGDIANVTKDLSAQQKFGTIHWYVTPGTAS